MHKLLSRLSGGVFCLTLALSGALFLNAPSASADEVDRSELQCLAEALYFEARGEPAAGQKAVAEVILNRVDSTQFPASVCGVVKQGGKGGCQFSYNCGGKSRAIREQAAFQRVTRIAEAALGGAPRDLTNGALYFHTPAVKPAWSRRFTQTTRIGRHIFYRPDTPRKIASK